MNRRSASSFCRLFVESLSSQLRRRSSLTHTRRSEQMSRATNQERGEVFQTRLLLRKERRTCFDRRHLFRNASGDEAAVRKQRLTLVQRGWHAELILRAQACCQFTFVSTSVGKPFRYIEQHPMSIVSVMRYGDAMLAAYLCR